MGLGITEKRNKRQTTQDTEHSQVLNYQDMTQELGTGYISNKTLMVWHI